MNHLRAHRTVINSLMVVLLAFWQIAQPLQAATFYWDNDANAANNNANTGAGLGNVGTWDTTSSKWWNLTNNTTWSNAGGDTAVFWGPTAGAVTLNTPITVGGLTFNTTGYTITNGTNALTFGATNNAITLNNVAAAGISGLVAGTGNVTLSGGVYGGQTAGVLTFNGTSATGWSGTTTINTGMTMALAASSQALRNTSGITLNGGGVTLTNANGTEGALDRVAAVGITANGGTITYTNTSGTGVYTETLGAVALTSGQLNIVETTNQAGAGSQTLTLGGLTRTGAANTSAVAFAAGSGLNTTKNMLVVTGATATAAGQIIGPWATVGTTAAAQTDYAVYNGSAQVVPLNVTASTQDAWTTAANAYTVNAAQTLAATRTITALRNTLAAGSVTLATGANLETYGVLNGAAALTIAPGTGGVLTTPTGGGNLFLTTGAGTMAVSAPINDNGGAVTVVKSGTGGTMTLSATTSNFSGGLVINAGTVSIAADTNLGATTGDITFNGSGGLTTTAGVALPAGRTITLNNGALATWTIGNQSGNSIAGQVTGTGGLIFVAGGTTGTTLTLSNTTNDFQGLLRIGNSTAAAIVAAASLADSVAANGAIRLGSTTGGGTFQWSAAATGALTLNNRQVDLAGTTGGGARWTIPMPRRPMWSPSTPTSSSPARARRR